MSISCVKARSRKKQGGATRTALFGQKILFHFPAAASFSSISPISAAALAAQLGREHFNYTTNDEWLAACQEADLLILDDLGTEYITPLTISVLYELINTRMLTHRPTIYTTNITDQSVFVARYTEKVASRMLGGCKMFKFFGTDQRLK